MDLALEAAAIDPPPQSDTMPAAYEIRAGGDGNKNKKQSILELQLRRVNEVSSRLREDVDRPRIKVSEASMS